MHVRVRAADGEERVVVLVSRLSAVQELRRAVRDKFSVPPDNQRLFYGGKLLENGYNLHDYSIKLNDVIQLMVRAEPQAQQRDREEDGKNSKKEGGIVYEDAKSNLYAVGDLIDMRDKELGAWFEGTILRIVRDPEYRPPVKIPASATLNGGPTTQNGGRATLNGGPTSPKSKKMTNGMTDSANDSKPSTPKEGKKDKTDTDKVRSETRGTPRKNGIIDSKQSTPKSGKKDNNDTERTSCDTQVSSPKTNGKADSKLPTPKSGKKGKNETEKTSCKTQVSSKNNGKIDSKLPTPKSGKKGKKDTNGENSVSSPKINGEMPKSPDKNEKSPNASTSSPKTPNRKRGITDYFSKTPKSSKKPEEKPNLTENDVNDAENGLSVENDEDVDSDTDVGVLYKINLVYDDINEATSHYCKPNEIRPRARRGIPVEQLTVGSTVMVNYNTENAYEKGYWYDFIVQEVLKQRKSYELIGTLFLGSECIPQDDTKIKLLDKIYAIEEVVPIKKRTEEYSKLITTPTEQRALPIICTTCRDNEKRPCRDCGCYTCAGKNDPEKIVLCDECNNGFHMSCLEPPMSELPEEDWYCVACKRDPNGVVAPGAARQARKADKAKGQRDWGRGMACVGKSQTCAMPANHFGPIPGVEVGMAWRFRIQLSESGVHRPPVSGIHGRDIDGAYSLVLSGGYEDDVDNGTEFTYTGSGGRDLSGNKRTADQSSDQTLTRENKALARNCAVKQVSEEGGDAGAAWRDGKPVRVVRSYKMIKHFPEYAPDQGVRYDGIYKVVKYYPETGKSGFRVWKYQLRRDDPNPAPWEATAKKYPIIFPEGYLEAEAEKKANKGKGKPKKRVLRESNHSDTESQASSGKQEDSGCESPPMKRRNTRQSKGEEDTPPTKRGRGRPRKIQSVSPKSPFSIASKLKPKSSPKSPKQSKTSPQKSPMKSPKSKLEALLAPEELESIRADDLNSKLWEECLDVCKNKGKQHLINHVRQLFLCIICQDVPASPVTTRCQHNFCMSCLKLAFRSTESHSCPYCRQDLSKEELVHNEPLKTALKTLMPGYDVGKK